MLAIHPAIIGSFVFCIFLFMYVVFEGYMKKLIKQGILGSLTMVVANYLVPPYIVITFNLWSFMIACLFGMPGVLIMYLIKFLNEVR